MALPNCVHINLESRIEYFHKKLTEKVGKSFK